MKLRRASLLCGVLRNDCTRGDSRSIRSRILEFLRSDDEGNAIVETAFMMPIFVILLTGMLSTVMGLYTFQQLTLQPLLRQRRLDQDKALSATHVQRSPHR